MAYRLDGTYFENCNCEVACPCSASILALPASYERCHLLLRRHSLRVGDAVDVEIEDFAGVEGSVMTLNGIAYPVGSTTTLAQATRARFSAFGYDLDLAGKNGHAAPFSWHV